MSAAHDPNQDAIAAHERGWSVIPVGSNKKPLLDKWTPYQTTQPTRDELDEWAREAGKRLAGWAVITGQLSEIVIIDFDGETGRQTADALGIQPHVRTGSGGYHLYVRHPGWPVKTLNHKSKKELGERYPGVDIRADGGYAVFTGNNESGHYQWLRDPTPDDLTVLPDEMRDFLGLLTDPRDKPEAPREAPAPLPFTPPTTPAPAPAARTNLPRRVPSQYILGSALSRLITEGRNDAGFWLACQLRDNNYTQAEARDVMSQYVDHCPSTNRKGEREAYELRDALESLRQAFTQPPRQPWPDKPLPDTSITRSSRNAAGTNNDNPPPAGGKKEPPTLVELRDLYLDQLELTGQYLIFHEVWGSWWRYKNGVYVQAPEASVLRDLDTTLQAAGHKNLSRNKLKDVLQKVQHADGIARPGVDLGPRHLNCANGILDLDTLNLQPHTPAFFSTVQTRATWQPDAQAPEFAKFLNYTLPRETDRWVLGQFFGYALTGDTDLQAALVMIGEGGTGKGTAIHVLSELLGGEADSSLVTSMALEDLRDGSPQVEALVGKRLLIASETSKQVDWLAFKRVTGEDRIMVNPKYRPAYSTRLVCKIIIQSNVIPHLGEDATNSSLMRRFIPLEFNQKPRQLTPHLRDKLTTPTELSGVLAWAVTCLHNLRQTGQFLQPGGTLARQMVENSNRVITFLDEECEEARDARIGSRELYKDYLDWCDGTRHRPVTETRFKTDCLAAASVLGWNVEAYRDKSSRGFLGIRKRRLL
jgi:P4 family phage/plasmid primase-like protien